MSLSILSEAALRDASRTSTATASVLFGRRQWGGVCEKRSDMHVTADEEGPHSIVELPRAIATQGEQQHDNCKRAGEKGSGPSADYRQISARAKQERRCVSRRRPYCCR